MLVALGLGNPGERYSGTRHNVGKGVVASTIERLGLRASPGHGDYYYAEDHSRDLALVIPATYMNTSGRVASQVLRHYGAPAESLLVVCDDFNLPLGTLRIRKQGSDGGHNGLGSIIYELGSQAFPRLRVGIGPLSGGVDPVDFVLLGFEPEEEALIEKAKTAAVEALLGIAADGLDSAMNVFNKRNDTDSQEA